MLLKKKTKTNTIISNIVILEITTEQKQNQGKFKHAQQHFKKASKNKLTNMLKRHGCV